MQIKGQNIIILGAGESGIGAAILATKMGANVFVSDFGQIKNAFKDLIANCNKITGATVCFHNSLKSFILPIELPEGYWHDAWLGLHASAQQGLMFTSQSLISYRIHENQQVGISRIINEDSYFKSIKKNIFVIIFFKKLIKIYPNEKGNLPILETKNILIKLLKKLKKKFRSILN